MTVGTIKITGLTLLLFLSGSSLYSQDFIEVPLFERQSELRDTNGIAVADYDADGDLDIYIVAVDTFHAGRPQNWSRLLRNDGNATYVDITEQTNLIRQNGVIKRGWFGAKMGASWGDYNNDGYPDLFLTNFGHDVLWKNDGKGDFINVTPSSGVRGCEDCYSVNGLWWDYDLDGDLDLYVSDWHKENRFYQNNGDGKFIDISESSGLNDAGSSWTSVPLDVDRDGDLDLYVINDFGANHLYRNDGLGLFVDKTEEFGLADDGDGMGVAIGDYGNDGHFDIYVTNIYDIKPNAFFINDGKGRFSNKAQFHNIDSTGWGWGARFFDVDHDMDEDLYVVNGMSLTTAKGDLNMFFKNEGGQFHDHPSNEVISSAKQARGLEVFDYDGDGDQDMLVTNREAVLTLYENESVPDEGGNWLLVKLKGTRNNRDALGSIVKVTTNGQDIYRYHHGVNLMGQSLKPLHFGLGRNENVDELEVTWPDGSIQVFKDVAINRTLTISEQGTITAIPKKKRIQVYPNPVRERLYVEVGETLTDKIGVTLLDINGRVVVNEVSSSLPIEIDVGLFGIKAGLHFLTVDTGKDRITTKILVK